MVSYSCDRRGQSGPSDAIDLCLRLAAGFVGVEPTHLRARGRASGTTARARHVAYYLAHVAAGLSMREVARLCGRHRTSIAYALSRIEEAREARAFDAAMSALECTIAGAGVHP